MLSNRILEDKGDQQMDCVFCNGETMPEITTSVTKTKNGVLIVKNIGADKCQQCGAEFYTGETTDLIEAILDKLEDIPFEQFVTDGREWKTLFEKLENEHDLRVIEEWEADPDKTTYTLEEVKQILDLN